MTSYETVYSGGNGGYSLNPSHDSLYQPITYKTDASSIGMTLDGRTANQLKDVGTKLASGAGVIEVSGASAGILESIPKQHFEEIKRQMKLAGAEVSMHAPVVEASGITQQGWDETDRLGAEKQLTSALLRGHDLDPKGNISVTTHSSAGLPELEQTTKIKEDGKDVEKTGKIWIINPRTGQLNVIKPQKRFFPEKGKFEKKGMEFNAQEEIQKQNQNQWTQSLSGINQYANYGENAIEGIYRKSPEGIPVQRTPEEIDEINELITKAQKIDLSKLKQPERQELEHYERQYNHGAIYLRDAYQQLKQMFDIAYSNKDISNEDKQKLQDFAKQAIPLAQEGIENNPKKSKEFVEMIEKGLKTLGGMKQTPKSVVPLKEFVLDKSSQTFANAATASYNKFGETAPILNIENPPAGGALSRGEELKNLVINSRKKMAENLIKEKGLSKGQAKKISEKMIGATWDVGHINMLRKQGYSEKDIVKETEKIAPFVKHVHLSDNFGFEHTELPMGMGNVPIKEIMKKLGEKGFEGKKIVEAIQWYEHFQDVPGQPPKMGGHALTQSYQVFDSPIYTTGVGYSWGQIPGLSTYAPGVGQGAIAPPVSQSTWGTSFSNLPQELGGQIGGDQSRFSGTPNQ